MKSQITYLASPYRHELEEVREERVRINKQFTLFYHKKYGEFLYSPLVFSESLEKEEALGDDFWIKHGLEMLKCCKKIIVLCLEGWGESAGVDTETDLAKELKIEIYYPVIRTTTETTNDGEGKKIDIDDFSFKLY